MSELLPKIEIDLTAGPISPADLFSFACTDIRLEIGFGDGEHLIAEAERRPDIGFIGCEPFVNGVAKALAAIDERKLANIRIHSGDARELLALLPAGGLGQIDLLYPDPWPKRRHHKRRIVSDEFLRAAARVLRPGAELRYATDIDDYCAWTLARAARSPEFSWPAARLSDWLQPWEGWFPTRYEQKARREGRQSAYLTFVRN